MYSIYWLIAKYLFLVGILKLANYKSNWRPWNELIACSSERKIPDGRRFRKKAPTHTHTHAHTHAPTKVLPVACLPSWLRFISEQLSPPISLVLALLLPNKLGTFALCPSEVMCFLLIFKINRYFRVTTNNPETYSEWMGANSCHTNVKDMKSLGYKAVKLVILIGMIFTSSSFPCWLLLKR